MKRVIIRQVQVVGMHHYGLRELSVGATYTVELETNNSSDGNAIAVWRWKKVGSIKERLRE